MKEKIFKDPIHGYITIPSLYCDNLLDTPLMQRLRYITQTSMRVLYPSAHHDRFTHSLGTFYLGGLAFHHLYKNIQEKFKKNIKEIENNHDMYKHTFLIACLLHDCAHSPFSHTFEHFFKVNDLFSDIKTKMITIDSNFEEDFKNCKPKQHELMSCLMILENYKDFINKYCDISLVIRSIIGCQHRITDNLKKQFENSLIVLLNGNAIDVDKLDYIMRDTWTSGFNNMSIDIHRLLSSLTLINTKDDNYVLGFKKNALSVIQNVITARNYLYEWIYCHHKVIYEVNLLEKSLEELVKQKGNNKILNILFSKEVFISGKEFKNYFFYLPTDGDILYIFKKYYNNINEIKELFSRKHKKSLWKSYAEFDTYFKYKSIKARINIKNQAIGFITNKLNYNVKDFLILDAKADVKEISKNEIFIEIDDECIPFDNFIERNPISAFDFFFLYLEQDKYNDKDKKKIISFLNKIN